MDPQSQQLAPRFRPYRTAAYLFYILVVGTFAILAIRSGTRSVLAMSPGRRPPVATPATVPECVDEARALLDGLEEKRRGLGASVPAAGADEEWARFRVSWVGRFRELESRCALESRTRKPLKRAFRMLEKAQDLYATPRCSTRESGLADALREALRRLAWGAAPSNDQKRPYLRQEQRGRVASTLTRR